MSPASLSCSSREAAAGSGTASTSSVARPRNSQRSGVGCTRVRRTYFRGGETPRGTRGVIGKQAILEVNGFTRLRRIDRLRPATTPSKSSPVDATTRTNPTTITSQAKLEDGPCAMKLEDGPCTIPKIAVAIAKTPVAISRRVTLQSKRSALRPIGRSYARLATARPDLPPSKAPVPKVLGRPSITACTGPAF